MKIHTLLVLAVLATLLSASLGYKILVVFPVPSRSHSILAKGFVDPLLRAGHEVSWATPYPDAKPAENLTIIDISERLKPFGDNLDMIQHSSDKGFLMDFTKNISTMAIETKSLREALINQQFDAVVTEWFFSDTDAGYAAVQQVPWIMFCGNMMNPHIEGLVDELRSTSTVPFMMTNFPTPMSFRQRFMNSVITGFAIPELSARYQQFFGTIAESRGVNLPPYLSALYNASIVFVNSHPSLAPAQSLPPNVVDVAGYHIDDKRQPLPKDIQDILDSSPHGVIYFSMGSVLKLSVIPEHTRKELIQILNALDYTVLWKSDQDIPGLPKNIHVRSWWPQASVLAHPNIKLFITHGGLLSTLEAVHYGVPLLAIPVYGDQPANADQAVRNGYARKVPYSPGMGAELRSALMEVLGNDGYYKRAKYLSKLFNSRPVPPAKLIAHYIELAIESKGAYHLRSKTFLYPWYQRWMLDQLAALLAVLYLLKLALKKLCSKVFGNKQNFDKKNK